MKLFIYNNFKRHWNNFTMYLLWLKEKRPTKFFPKAGKITNEDISWAKKILEKGKE